MDTSYQSSVVYPTGKEEALRTLSAGLSLLAVTIISYCFAKRAVNVDFLSRGGLSSINVTKWLLLLLFADSWAFVFLSGLLVNGIGMSLNKATCELGIYSCIIFYCVSKLLTYMFLLEKVYIVWPNKGSRWSSTAYKVGFGALSGFAVVIVMMFIGRIAYIRDDRQCVIGLQKASSMTTLFVDLFVNILLTSMFLWPLLRINLLSPNLRKVAKRTFIASTVALTISAVNMAVLTILHGRELGWICLASCSTDVLINALVLFWLTQPGFAKDERSTAGDVNGTDGQTAANRSDHHLTKSAVSFQMRRVTLQAGIDGSSAGGRASSNIRPMSSFTPSDKAMMSPILLKGHGPSVVDPNVLAPPPSPSKVNFQGYTSVYDGTQSYFRQNSDQTPFGGDDIKGENASSVYMPHDVESGNERVIIRDIRPTSSIGFFDRILGRKTSTGGGRGHSRSITEGMKTHRSQGSIPAAISTFGGIGRSSKKQRRESDEDVGVRVTITTRMDVEEYIDIVDPGSAKVDGIAEESRGSESTKGGYRA
ncbi:hypothetical protein CPB86DRAFT_816282 [Serendipita vermifera]|nr:hypothetical protein CPB86DRAFT_816282 [Serendipita vermifera]